MLVAEMAKDEPDVSHKLTKSLIKLFKEEVKGRRILIFCVGASTSTGDCLGPMVGTLLQKKKHRTFDVLGTLESPIHATNLDRELKELHDELYVLGVDAAVGPLGTITIHKGALGPGAGMGKNLPRVGHAHIMVSTTSFSFGLWFADMALVWDMAHRVADAIYKAAKEEHRREKVRLRRMRG